MSNTTYQPAELPWHIIINPNSGKHRAHEKWNILKKILERNGVIFYEHYTSGHWDAAMISASEAGNGASRFIIVGGDGTLHEAVNGYFLQNKMPVSQILSVQLPVGTGNDWRRYYRAPVDPESVANLIFSGKTFLQDAACLEYLEDGQARKKYFFNVSGAGFDGFVSAAANKKKRAGNGGKLQYILSLLSSLKKYRTTDTEILADGRVIFRGALFSMSAGICSYNGGGMKQLPRAVHNDGLIDLTVIGKMSRAEIIANVPRLFNGKIYNNRHITFSRAKEIVINALDIPVEADGEDTGTTPVKITVLPDALLFAGEF